MVPDEKKNMRKTVSETSIELCYTVTIPSNIFILQPSRYIISVDCESPENLQVYYLEEVQKAHHNHHRAVHHPVLHLPVPVQHAGIHRPQNLGYLRISFLMSKP